MASRCWSVSGATELDEAFDPEDADELDPEKADELSCDESGEVLCEPLCEPLCDELDDAPCEDGGLDGLVGLDELGRETGNTAMHADSMTASTGPAIVRRIFVCFIAVPSKFSVT